MPRGSAARAAALRMPSDLCVWPEGYRLSSANDEVVESGAACRDGTLDQFTIASTGLAAIS